MYGQHIQQSMLEMSLFSSIFVPLPLPLCRMERTSCVFPFCNPDF